MFFEAQPDGQSRDIVSNLIPPKPNEKGAKSVNQFEEKGVEMIRRSNQDVMKILAEVNPAFFGMNHGDFLEAKDFSTTLEAALSHLSKDQLNNVLFHTHPELDAAAEKIYRYAAHNEPELVFSHWTLPKEWGMDIYEIALRRIAPKDPIEYFSYLSAAIAHQARLKKRMRDFSHKKATQAINSDPLAFVKEAYKHYPIRQILSDSDTPDSLGITGIISRYDETVYKFMKLAVIKALKNGTSESQVMPYLNESERQELKKDKDFKSLLNEVKNDLT